MVHMKSTDFVVLNRPRLAAIRDFPTVEFADYERRLATMQETLQLVQQAEDRLTLRGRLGLAVYDDVDGHAWLTPFFVPIIV